MSAVKRLIASKINAFVYMIYVCVCAVYVYLSCIYKYTHMHVYISENMLRLYIKFIDL